ncbi:MAG: hypothetical protein IJB52_10370 [Clostridia bacterium]|nr:hypothetical protein [Clostridia bacterium]
MTRNELKEFRRLRWKYIKTGSGWIMRSRRYRDLYLDFWIDAEKLDGVQRVIFVEYYHNARSIVYIAMQLNYSERTVLRIKSSAVGLAAV